MDLEKDFEKEKKDYAKKQLDGFVKYYYDQNKDMYSYTERAECTRHFGVSIEGECRPKAWLWIILAAVVFLLMVLFICICYFYLLFMVKCIFRFATKSTKYNFLYMNFCSQIDCCPNLCVKSWGYHGDCGNVNIHEGTFLDKIASLGMTHETVFSSIL